MQKSRLDALADGIFAIVMTILVLEIRVPDFFLEVNNETLWIEIQRIAPLFSAYFLSFLVLSTYWIAHNYIISSYAKNLTRTLAYLNIPFLAFVALVPFSSHFLGKYYFTQFGIALYATNIILIGIFLATLLAYTTKSKEIKNDPHFSRADIHRGYIRAFLPPVAACVAVLVSFWSTTVALFVFAIGFLFNLFPKMLHAVLRALHND